MNTPPWWLQDPLSAGSSGLTLDGHALRALARQHGTPLYAYSARRIRASVASLKETLEATGLPWRIHYACKANRFGPILGLMRDCGVGLDACSPREVQRALAHGFRPGQISFTGSYLSERDLDALVASGVHVNLDARSLLRRYGARVPAGTPVGLRLDPGVLVSYDDNPKVAYANSKFGVLPDDVPEYIALAHAAGLVVDTLHMHLGWGLPRRSLDRVESALAWLAGIVAAYPHITTLNLGGGLGARRKQADDPLMPEDLVEAIRRHLGPLGRTIAVEPGTLLVDAAGVLVVEVACVNQKGPVTWVGVNAGHAINVYAAHYGLPGQLVHADRPLDPPAATVSIAGHINEANDVFAQGVALPAVEEGDLLALLPAGAYGTSMASDHCLRGEFQEILIDD